LEDPKKIDFEDDIVMIIQSFIRRLREITPVMWEVFSKFPSILEKNKHQLRELFDTVNLFLQEGKEGFK
jgi:hypothetical protein